MVYQSTSRPYTRWLLSNSLSLIGDQIFQIAFSTAALKAGASITVFTTVVTISAIPRIIFLSLAGYITCTNATRTILQAITAIKVLFILGAGVITSFNIANEDELIALSLVMATLDSLATPCRVSLLPTIVSKEALPSIAALYQKITILASIIIPLPAGWIIGKFGADAAFYVVSLSPIGLLFFLRALPPSEKHPIPNVTAQNMRNGFIYLTKSKPLSMMIIMLATFTLCVSGPLKISVAYVAKSSNDPSMILGAISLASATGGIFGICISKYTTHCDEISKMLFCTLTISSLFIAYAVMGIIPWFLLFISFALGVVTSVINIDTTTFIFSRCRHNALGALSSTVGITTIVSTSLSMMLCGAISRAHQHSVFLVMGLFLGIISILTHLYLRQYPEPAPLV